MKGYISRQHTAWCAFCLCWEQVDEQLMRDAVKRFRRMGWKKTGVHGWVCPKCVGERIADEQTELG